MLLRSILPSSFPTPSSLPNRRWLLAAGALLCPAVTAAAATGPDFDNDGFADLVIGTPFAGQSAGIIQVAWGSGTGLWATDLTTLDEGLPGVPGPMKPHNEFGIAITWGDFDNDGFDDLAVGVPNRRVGNGILGPNTEAGCVHVFYGGADGLSDQRVQTWHQNKPGVPDWADRDELFGWSLAAGDFNSDGFADLAIGVPHERIALKAHAGGVNLLYGSAQGLQTVGAKFITQDSQTIPGVADTGELFGYILAAGDFNGDGDDDLAIGAPEDETDQPSKGSVTILYGSLFGISAAGAEVWQSSNIAPGTAPDNEFGFSLAVGDFNDDGRDDLAVGCPFDNTIRGRVVILPGTALGLDGDSAVALHATSSATMQAFGWAVTSGDFNADGYADLAVGAPLDDIGSAQRAGRVHVIFGSEGGLDTFTREIWTQLDINGSGGIATDEWLGMALTVGDFDSNGADDLVMASPFEDVDGRRDSGGVVILPGSALGFVPAMSQFWTQPLLGRPATRDEAMGFSLMR